MLFSLLFPTRFLRSSLGFLVVIQLCKGTHGAFFHPRSYSCTPLQTILPYSSSRKLLIATPSPLSITKHHSNTDDFTLIQALQMVNISKKDHGELLQAKGNTPNAKKHFIGAAYRLLSTISIFLPGNAAFASENANEMMKEFGSRTSGVDMTKAMKSTNAVDLVVKDAAKAIDVVKDPAKAIDLAKDVDVVQGVTDMSSYTFLLVAGIGALVVGMLLKVNADVNRDARAASNKELNSLNKDIDRLSRDLDILESDAPVVKETTAIFEETSGTSVEEIPSVEGASTAENLNDVTDNLASKETSVSSMDYMNSLTKYTEYMNSVITKSTGPAAESYLDKIKDATMQSSLPPVVPAEVAASPSIKEEISAPAEPDMVVPVEETETSTVSDIPTEPINSSESEAMQTTITPAVQDMSVTALIEPPPPVSKSDLVPGANTAQSSTTVPGLIEFSATVEELTRLDATGSGTLNIPGLEQFSATVAAVVRTELDDQ